MTRTHHQLLHFWLGHVLCATTACTFSTSALPKVVRPWCAFDISTWKRASRHNGIHFFDVSTSKSAPELRCFLNFIWSDGSAPAALASLLFDPPEPQIIAKTQWIATFLPFSCTCIFFFLFLSLLWSSHFFSSPPWLFTPLLFHLSVLSEVRLLNFLRLQ